MVANRSLMPRICSSASAETVSGSCSSRIRGHLLAVGGELGQNFARGWCPAEEPVGVGGGEALVESERVCERAEFVSSLLHRDRAGGTGPPGGDAHRLGDLAHGR
jgi:hypothetical protein